MGADRDRYAGLCEFLFMDFLLSGRLDSSAAFAPAQDTQHRWKQNRFDKMGCSCSFALGVLSVCYGMLAHLLCARVWCIGPELGWHTTTFSTPITGQLGTKCVQTYVLNTSCPCAVLQQASDWATKAPAKKLKGHPTARCRLRPQRLQAAQLQSVHIWHVMTYIDDILSNLPLPVARNLRCMDQSWPKRLRWCEKHRFRANSESIMASQSLKSWTVQYSE